jgi:hypothetical protein
MICVECLFFENSVFDGFFERESGLRGSERIPGFTGLREIGDLWTFWQLIVGGNTS